jgi:type VI secretion system secreted protein Hcp
MRIVHRGRLFVLCAVVAALLPALPARAAGDIFLKIDGIKGESASGSIHVISVVRDSAISGAAAGNAGTSAGKRMHSTITITKEIDKASPLLLSASNAHQTLRNVTISAQGATGAKTAQNIVLTNATIVSIRKTGTTEQITFDYQSIEVTYTGGNKTATDDWLAPS